MKREENYVFATLRLTFLDIRKRRLKKQLHEDDKLQNCLLLQNRKKKFRRSNLFQKKKKIIALAKLKSRTFSLSTFMSRGNFFLNGKAFIMAKALVVWTKKAIHYAKKNLSNHGSVPKQPKERQISQEKIWVAAADEKWPHTMAVAAASGGQPAGDLASTTCVSPVWGWFGRAKWHVLSGEGEGVPLFIIELKLWKLKLIFPSS